MAHVRHDEGRGLRLESVVGCGASRRKAKKRNAACEVSVRGRRNKSVRPCRRSPLRGHSFPSCHPIFFFLPRCQLRHRSQNERHETSGCRAWPCREQRKSTRENEREKGSGNDGRSERAVERQYSRYVRALATCAMAIESVENESR